MAIVRKHTTGETWTDASAVSALLASHGLVYEAWDISKLASRPKPADVDDQTHILDVFADEVRALSTTRGYQAADVVALRPEMPNLNDLLAKFDKEHTHAEDEVRFTVSGRGIFAIRGKDGELYDIEVHPGDLLAVPEGTQHYFTLCEERHIQCIRLFSETQGWIAEYIAGGAQAPPIGTQAPAAE